MRVSHGASLLLLAALAAGDACAARPKPKTLPADAAAALQSATQVELYSLEPWYDPDAKEPLWHDNVLLGHVTLSTEDSKRALAELDAAMKSFDGKTVTCAEARQGIRVQSGGHDYDFLLSYGCRDLDVFRDDKKLGSLGIGGSPKALNAMLKAAKLPLSQSDED